MTGDKIGMTDDRDAPDMTCGVTGPSGGNPVWYRSVSIRAGIGLGSITGWPDGVLDIGNCRTRRFGKFKEARGERSKLRDSVVADGEHELAVGTEALDQRFVPVSDRLNGGAPLSLEPSAWLVTQGGENPVVFS